LSPVYKRIEREWLTVPGIHRLDFQTSKFFEAGLQVRQVVDVRRRRWSVCVQEQVAAEQIAAGRQDTDGALRVSWNVKDPGTESVLGQFIAIFDIDVGPKSVGCA
jgi:hypothetical protein